MLVNAFVPQLHAKLNQILFWSIPVSLMRVTKVRVPITINTHEHGIMVHFEKMISHRPKALVLERGSSSNIFLRP
jgi:hypothetical protein